jgi:hypothetical protein
MTAPRLQRRSGKTGSARPQSGGSATSIEEVERIGEVAGGKLRAVGIGTTDALLMAGASAAGGGKVSSMTGNSEGQLLEWSTMST